MNGNPENQTPPADEAGRVEAANQALKDAEWAEQAGLLERAVTGYRTVISLYPGIYQVHNNLANVLLTIGKPQEALVAARQAAALNPDDPLVNANLGQALWRSGLPDEAIAPLRKALDRQPEMHPLRRMLADALLELGRTDEAVAVFEGAERRFPNDPVLLEAMAQFYHRARKGGDAERCYLRLLQINPQRAGTCNDLAMLYLDYAQFSKGREFAEKGLALEPGSPVLWNTLANAQQSLGLMEDAIRSYRKVMELAPYLALAHSNLLLTLHYVSGVDPAEIFAEHQRWGERHAPARLAATSFPNRPDPDRRLRVGYLSQDIRRHSVAFFLEPLLEHRDRDRFELYCYADIKTPDEVTQRLKAHFDRYHSITGRRTREIIDLMRADELDILVDLGGHAGNQHAPVLGHKPAPILVTYLGYPDTTGIAAVDYRLTDGLADPPGAEARHTEELVRLPGSFLCFAPPADAPELAPPPCIASGVVTFGSFNREFKVSRQTYDLWCRILAAVPGSRILMKSIAGDDPATREHQLGEFESRGISRDRVQLVGFIASQAGHLASYRDVDIALDTYPYHGTTTTLDSLLMGVPVITLAGVHHASRVGVSLLTAVGVPEFIAHSDDEYVAKAVALAGDLPALTALHASLRERLLESPLCDGPGFTARYEAALIGMWQRWCATRAAAG